MLSEWRKTGSISFLFCGVFVGEAAVAQPFGLSDRRIDSLV